MPDPSVDEPREKALVLLEGHSAVLNALPSGAVLDDDLNLVDRVDARPSGPVLDDGMNLVDRVEGSGDNSSNDSSDESGNESIDSTPCYEIAEMTADAASMRFTEYALTGHVHDNPRQVAVSLIDNRLNTNIGLKALRDFDSVIGMSNDLPYTSGLQYHIFPKADRSLRNNVHINRKIGVSSHMPLCSFCSVCRRHDDMS